jgi:cytochrome c peroxidase
VLAHGQPQNQSPRAQVLQRAQALELLGRKMFFDPALSASGKIACATCHDPAFAYGPPNALPVQPGGKSGQAWGIRAVPSLRYLQAIPQFTEHGFEEETNGDDSIDNGPTGGLTWDGRVDRGRQQARVPLLSPYEMGNDSQQSVVIAALHAPYADDLRKLTTQTGTQAVFETMLEAFEAWEQNYAEFYPYSSKYDAWLAGRTELSSPELRGLRLFEDPTKGNCARCHIASRSVNGSPPQFTDYGLVALGVPRNPAIPANADLSWYDLGMCGPLRTDFSGRDQYCGRFMTPSLRNVATRQAFFHNGVVHSLKDAVAFYVDRDNNPGRFDDLPQKYRANIETEAPFHPPRDHQPVLTEKDIDDIVAFLKTLNDGWTSVQQH